MRTAASGGLLVLVVLALSGPGPAVHAQQQQQANVNRENAEIVARLFRSSMIALHQANVTGNYTVLRDLAAPGFRDRNSAADLTTIFAGIRQAKIDLGVAAVLDPRLIAAPRVDEQGLLRFGGTLATRPVAVVFELAFQVVDNEWRLFGISIKPIQTSAPAPTTPPPAAKSAPPAAKSSAPAAKLAPPAAAPSARDPWFFPGGPSR